MEPYFSGFKHMQQDYEVTLELTSEETHKSRNAQNSRTGSYGVSIRVQGIDGHPYIVLNNTEGCLSENPPPSGKEQQVISQTVSKPAADSNTAFKLEDKSSEHTKFPGTQHMQPCVLKSLKITNMDEKENGISDFKDGTMKSSNLLNFQRHPELLQPYDPEKNNLNLDNYQSSVCSESKSFADEKTEAKPWISSSKVVSLQKTNTYLAEPTKVNSKKIQLNRLVEAEDQNKQLLDCPSGTIGPSEVCVSESFSSAGGSPCVSPTVYPETRKSRPDVLPFRRQDSAGPVLDYSRRSSSSSATPTSANSLYKFLLDDQEYAIYADNVNRHENRRYIPFLPGTGRDIDTGSLPGVDQLIEKFDKKVDPHRRGRSGKRNRINPDDRKRSRSVDSALSLGLDVDSDYLGECSKSLGKSAEHLLRPSKVCLHKQLSRDQKPPSREMKISARSIGKLQMPDKDTQNSNFNSLQYHKQNGADTDSLMFRSSTLPGENKREEIRTVTSTLLLPNRITVPSDSGTKKISVKTFSSVPNIQATPDLLKGQQDLAQQTNEETAKQILYNYLKEGADNDDATKRKVNLVFEKIQTLKSRAAGKTQVSDSSAEVKALVEQKAELERKVEELQKKLDLEIRNQQNSKEERDATRASLKDLQLQLDESICEKEALKKQLEESEKELRQNLEELFQVKMEQEQHQTEIRDLQDQLSEMHDELDNAKHTDEGEKEVLIEELMQMKQDLQEVLIAKDQQEEILRKRERELTALKGALKEEVSSHDMEMDKLKEKHDKEVLDLQQSLEEATESAAVLARERNAVQELQNSLEDKVKELTEENEQLKRTVDELEKKIEELHKQICNMKGEENSVNERIKRYEEEKQQLEEALKHAEKEAKELVVLKRSLESQLEDMQENIRSISEERQQLTQQLKDETHQKEQLKQIKNEMENERLQLNKTVEKLQEEMSEMVEVSRTSAVELQNQLVEYKEKNRRELADMQRQLKEKNLEVEKSRLTTMRMQDEMRLMEENLRDHQRAQDEAITKTQLLEQTVKGLEYELEAKSHLKDDRARQIKLMEDKLSHLELELDEEKTNSDLLSERISRCREQIEQMRTELLQERAIKQDLECDKISLERQNKDLKSRILHLEGSYRSSKEGLVAQMEARITELEERLENEERDRANFQLSNRRLERKVKELMLQVDDEHLSLTDQKDQLSLRLKAMKRQVEEAEEEIDRLEGAKKKLQRELEEQLDVNEQLQGQLNAAKKELSRLKKSPSKVLADSDDDDDDDDFSTDGDSLCEVPSGNDDTKI
ncbi:cingulin-like protein 1 isoform X3 [Falco biarmicus]|uniref:cingulin-like protein 1 isoform X2 n=1 Tax=Falco rusticolus TaxID=120794 RepID=UPI000FFCC3D8|nr:cingulin-like protein 1 isoform X2 [Falco rusticolus]XP_055571615.1 cingulin-like protein 1 isoform X3 [Falco cherrug]XP_056201653.1 cingulin-like protein 1 isoform X3 [Falco biarmicus]